MVLWCCHQQVWDLRGVLSAQIISLGHILRAGCVWSVTTLFPTWLLLSQSHTEATSSASKT